MYFQIDEHKCIELTNQRIETEIEDESYTEKTISYITSIAASEAMLFLSVNNLIVFVCFSDHNKMGANKNNQVKGLL